MNKVPVSIRSSSLSQTDDTAAALLWTLWDIVLRKQSLIKNPSITRLHTSSLLHKGNIIWKRCSNNDLMHHVAGFCCVTRYDNVEAVIVIFPYWFSNLWAVVRTEPASVSIITAVIMSLNVIVARQIVLFGFDLSAQVPWKRGCCAIRMV